MLMKRWKRLQLVTIRRWQWLGVREGEKNKGTRAALKEKVACGKSEAPKLYCLRVKAALLAPPDSLFCPCMRVAVHMCVCVAVSGPFPPAGQGKLNTEDQENPNLLRLIARWPEHPAYRLCLPATPQSLVSEVWESLCTLALGDIGESRVEMSGP